MSGTQIWSPADMREKLSKWKESKRQNIDSARKHNSTTNKSNNMKERSLKKSSRKKNASSFVEHNDENAPNNRNRNRNKFGYRKPATPAKDKRKIDNTRNNGRQPLTPANKKCRTPFTDHAMKETSVAEIAGRCLPSEEEVRGILTKKVCVGLRRHELSKKVTRLQKLLKATRNSYNEYLSGMRVLIEKCQQRESKLAIDADDFREKNEILSITREELEHTISNLKEEQKTHVRNITELIDAKKVLMIENNAISVKAQELTKELQNANDENESAQSEIQMLKLACQEKKKAYDMMKAEFEKAKEDAVKAISTLKTEHFAQQKSIEANADAAVREANTRLTAENTKVQVLEAHKAGLEEKVQKLDSANTVVTKAKDELQGKLNELLLTEVRNQAQISSLQGAVDQLKAQIVDKESAHQKSMENFSKILDQNEKRAKRSDEEKDSLTSRISELTRTHQKLQESSRSLESKCSNLESQLADAIAKGTSANEDLMKAMEQVSQSEQQLTDMQEKNKSLEREYQSAQEKFLESKTAWEDSHSMLTAQVEQGKEAIEALQEKLKITEHEVITKAALHEATQAQVERLEAKSLWYENNMNTNVKDVMKQMTEMLESREEMSKQLSSQDHLAQDFESAKREIFRLQNLLNVSETARRKLHNRVQELRGNIRVFVRVRPFLPSDGVEFNEKHPSLRCLPDGQGINIAAKKEHKFAFDRVFKRESSQSEVFEEVSELVQSALDGYNVCIFSYGQTGSGKTYTMQGMPNEPEKAGLIPRSMKQILETARHMNDQGWTFDFQASFVEIYNEQVRDLLRKSGASVSCDIKRSTKGKTYVNGVEKMSMRNMDDVKNIVRIASNKRAVGCTAMNSVSSRSHSIFTIFITGTCEKHSKRIMGALNLCDLAGSERLARSKAKGAALKETQAINKSLSALADVFMALKAKQAHIPYRNSKLTYLLENCFSKDGKTMMLVNVSPTQLSQQETTCSLRFAQQVNQCELGKASAQIQDLKARNEQTKVNGKNKSLSTSRGCRSIKKRSRKK
jgi:kinesin family protein C1